MRKALAKGLVTVLLVTALFPFQGGKRAFAQYYTIDSNLLVPKSVHPAELDDFIRSHSANSPLIGLGQAWVNAQNKDGIDAVYLMSHAILESGWGFSDIARDKKNIYGYGAYDTDPYGGAYTFSSFEECIDKVSGWILEDYLSPGGSFYTAYGPTLRGMNVHYATSQTWAQSIANLMNQFYSMYPFQAQPPPDPFLSRAYVTHIYWEVLGRGPDQSGLNNYVAAMIGNYLPRRVVVSLFLNSNEYNTSFITSLYQEILGRSPIGGEEWGWMAAMRNGMTERTIRSSFFGSDEYYSRIGSTNQNYVTSLYQNILGRSPQAGEDQGWINVLNSGVSRTDVAYGFLSSTEHFSRFIISLYGQILKRSADSGGLSAWLIAMSDSHYPIQERQVRRDLYASDEFLGGSVIPYVTALYRDILGRSPDFPGLMSFRSALVSGLPRSAAANVFLSSSEYRLGFIRNLYWEVLRHQADESSVGGWVNAMNAGLSERSARAAFYGSGEYFASRGNSNNSDYLNALYAGILGRSPDGPGLSLWLSALNSGMSRDSVAYGFLSSTECYNRYVRSLYADILHRVPDDAGLNAWVTNMSGGLSEKDVKASFYGSDEYSFQNL